MNRPHQLLGRSSRNPRVGIRHDGHVSRHDHQRGRAGGVTLAVAGLTEGLAAVLPDVPFLCHYRRAAEITDCFPYQELVVCGRTHRNVADRDVADRVFATLRYSTA